jgi:hypothetical protein
MIQYWDLVQEFNTGWNDYWPFLDTFTTWAPQDGLRKLEGYLRNRFQDAGQKLNHEATRNSGNKKYRSTKDAVNGCPSVPTEQSENIEVMMFQDWICALHPLC